MTGLVTNSPRGCWVIGTLYMSSPISAFAYTVTSSSSGVTYASFSSGDDNLHSIFGSGSQSGSPALDCPNYSIPNYPPSVPILQLPLSTWGQYYTAVRLQYRLMKMICQTMMQATMIRLQSRFLECRKGLRGNSFNYHAFHANKGRLRDLLFHNTSR